MCDVSFAERLIKWQKSKGRHNLPWQINPTPYRVWISEIMLQQTQVKTVIPYYERFMQRFPTVGQIANAELSEVLLLWSGLGYYARARFVHKSAKIICEKHAGELPQGIDELMALPGIGESIAGAILSLASDKSYAVMDANVRRVIARHADIKGWYGKSAVNKQFWTITKQRLPQLSAGIYNQALMDMGAMICSAKNPHCDICPVQRDCCAYHNDLIDQRPTKKPRIKRTHRHFSVVIVRHKDHILLEQRPEQGIWGGLMSFPESADVSTATAWCLQQFGSKSVIKELPQQTYNLTHQCMKIKPLYCELERLPSQVNDNQRYVWCKMKRTKESIGTPTLVKHLLENIEKHNANGKMRKIEKRSRGA